MECEDMARLRKYGLDGYNEQGFNRKGIHRNGTLYDDDGYNKDGFDEDGFGRDGHNRAGYDRFGFHRNGIHRISGSKYYRGYDKDGYDEKGYDRRGFKKNRIHKNGTYYDEKGFDKDGYNKKGYDEDGYDKKGFNRDEIHINGTLYDDDGFSKYDINKDGINRETGEVDERVELVKKYLEAGISKVAFCLNRKMNVEDFNDILKIVTQAYPSITQAQLDSLAQKSSERYYQKLRRVATDFESGDMSVEEFSKSKLSFDEVSRLFSSPKVKTEMRRKVYEYMASGEMNMMQYFSVLLKSTSKKDYKSAMDEYEHWVNIAKNVPEFKSFVPSLYQERKRLAKFERPYKDGQGLKVGYKDPTTKKDVLVEMTKEHEKYAKEYLRKAGDYICQSTMQSIFQQFARGTLTFDDVKTAEYRDYHDDVISVDDDLSETLREAIDDVRAKQSELCSVREEREALETVITTEKTKALEQGDRINNRKKVTHSKPSTEDIEF